MSSEGMGAWGDRVRFVSALRSAVVVASLYRVGDFDCLTGRVVTIAHTVPSAPTLPLAATCFLDLPLPLLPRLSLPLCTTTSLVCHSPLHHHPPSRSRPPRPPKLTANFFKQSLGPPASRRVWCVPDASSDTGSDATRTPQPFTTVVVLTDVEGSGSRCWSSLDRDVRGGNQGESERSDVVCAVLCGHCVRLNRRRGHQQGAPPSRPSFGRGRGRCHLWGCPLWP